MRILLPIDGSDCTDSTLDWVIATYRPKQVEIYLLFVIAILPDLNTAEFEVNYATDILSHRSQNLAERGYPVSSAEYVVGTDPAGEICKYADKMKADTIVIGSHGRHGLSKLLMGSVSSEVLEHCHCPVTVHHEV